MKTSSMLGYVLCTVLNQTGSDHISLFPIIVVTGIFLFFYSGNIGLNKVYLHIINKQVKGTQKQYGKNCVTCMVKLCLYGKTV